MAVLFLFTALVCLSLAVAILFSVPEVRVREDAYRAARPCPTSTPDEMPDCILEFPATVVGVRTVGGGRSAPHHEARLKSAYTTTVWVRFDTDLPIAAGLLPGDQVTARSWRGDVTSVSRLGATQVTSHAPDNDSIYGLVLASALAVFAIYALWCGTWTLLHTEDYRAGRTKPLTAPGIALLGLLPVLLLATAATHLLNASPWLLGLFGLGCLTIVWKWTRPSSVRHAAG
ncbi:hypothetical protein [Streptomyces sp. NBC_00347]|uniref:hypothetical protein n=1 Tax=Streptomyces sp. NBC_00347 TaxID=2975721 RepID=UPI0022547A62|nr:hypothetical protein [Streptomyces sp. NBC_00347]MCX5124631.1 hypothetical protein [Streptomyces sp. NBC_00347]